MQSQLSSNISRFLACKTNKLFVSLQKNYLQQIKRANNKVKFCSVQSFKSERFHAIKIMITFDPFIENFPINKYPT